MTDLKIRRIPNTDPRLQRHVVHDPQSRAFPAAFTVDKSTWKSKTIRQYDPVPNPNQPVGNCTTCAKAMQLNSAGNRKTGVVFGMPVALDWYRRETQLDPFPGTWEPDDTGSNGLSSCKVAQEKKVGGTYKWLFGGADEVVQAIMAGWTVSVGTAWYDGMFDQDSKGVIEPTGPIAGGHQYLYRGYDERNDMLIGRCWWGSFRDFKIKREHANELLLDDGDAHIQERV